MRTASGIDGIRRDGADGSSGGVINSPPGAGSVASEARASTVACEGVKDGEVPDVVELETDLEAITSSSCTFFHNAHVASEGDHPFDSLPCHLVLLVEDDIPCRLKAFHKMLIA